MNMTAVAQEKSLGQRITEARELADLSPAQLARRLGIKTQTLLAWERDESEPRANRLLPLAGIVNANVGWLLQGCGAAPVGHSAAGELAEMRQQIARIRACIDEAEQGLDLLTARLLRLQEDLEHKPKG